jgi:hypothetical protein
VIMQGHRDKHSHDKNFTGKTASIVQRCERTAKRVVAAPRPDQLHVTAFQQERVDAEDGDVSRETPKKGSHSASSGEP